MAQVFRRSANSIAKASILGGVVLVVGLMWGALQLQRSAYFTYAGAARPQPVPFPHEHHIAGLGIDCRYCHTSVETSGFAGIPPTKTCMNCHSQIWTAAPMLAPVRESYRTGRSLVWTRTHDLPDFAYFDHSIHINKGVGCDSCHGRVDQMSLMYNEASLQMEWCLACHRAPEKVLRPHYVKEDPKVPATMVDQVFNMKYKEPTPTNPVWVREGDTYRKFESQTGPDGLGTYLLKANQVRSPRDITSCNTCHR